MNEVAQKRRLGIEIVQDYIDMAIIEKIAEGRAARWYYVGKTATSRRRDFLEFRSVQIAEELRALRPGRSPVFQIHLLVHVAAPEEQAKQSRNSAINEHWRQRSK